MESATAVDTAQSQNTSTAELLNVRHAGAGLMSGRPRGPNDLSPCGLYVMNMYQMLTTPEKCTDL